ncbi:hypothetical protein LX32DRAFT_352442 [Colletotrichum zoysiae]|uniref:Uncharacterized protein n=1 Tax=Colletotrichum zoysiae TaxID=1216348 RepID=A0AAD9M1Q9_9PEZI|nr:hypothetical protein LX32DRAFT_352442 [Colletotrichum zoysiae]
MMFSGVPRPWLSDSWQPLICPADLGSSPTFAQYLRPAEFVELCTWQSNSSELVLYLWSSSGPHMPQTPHPLWPPLILYIRSSQRTEFSARSSSRTATRPYDAPWLPAGMYISQGLRRLWGQSGVCYVGLRRWTEGRRGTDLQHVRVTSHLSG